MAEPTPALPRPKSRRNPAGRGMFEGERTQQEWRLPKELAGSPFSASITCDFPVNTRDIPVLWAQLVGEAAADDVKHTSGLFAPATAVRLDDHGHEGEAAAAAKRVGGLRLARSDVRALEGLVLLDDSGWVGGRSSE